jgi:membrane protein YqaA with SNARE-associated domain
MLLTLIKRFDPKAVWKWVHGLGVPGLFLLGILDNLQFFSTPAGGVDSVLILLAWHNPRWWVYYALVTTAGEVIGGYLTYRASEKGGEQAFERQFGRARMEQVYGWFNKRGAGLVVGFGAILPPPFPYTPVITAAGVAHYPKNRFLRALIAGRSARYLAEAFLGKRYGQALIDFFSKYYQSALLVLIVLAILGGIAALVYFKWYKPRAQRKSSDQRSGLTQA